MFYRLRRADGSTDPISAGSLVAPDGGKRALDAGDVRIVERRRWTAPGGVVYPVAWTLELPELDLVVDIDARVDDQEHRHTVRYWEGAVSVAGRSSGGSLEGVGYVELTGYADAPAQPAT